MDEAQATAVIEGMKTAGTYEAQAKAIVEHNIKLEEEAAIQAQQQMQQENLIEQQKWDAYTNAVKDHLVSSDGFGDFKFDDKIRKDLLKTVTFIDKDGYTELDRAVQSKENSIKAAIAVKYWSQLEAAIKSVGVSAGKASVLDILSTDAAELQNDSKSKVKQSKGVDIDLANMM
jgi:hypothetical protein